MQGIDALLDSHGPAGQQPGRLYGPYWVPMLLQPYGDFPALAVDVAKAAATVLPSQGNPSDWLLQGATSRNGEGDNTIPTMPDIDKCGTSVDGLIQATETLSQGRLANPTAMWFLPSTLTSKK